MAAPISQPRTPQLKCLLRNNQWLPQQRRARRQELSVIPRFFTSNYYRDNSNNFTGYRKTKIILSDIFFIFKDGVSQAPCFAGDQEFLKPFIVFVRELIASAVVRINRW
jgi:hypothetical protein